MPLFLKKGGIFLPIGYNFVTFNPKKLDISPLMRYTVLRFCNYFSRKCNAKSKLCIKWKQRSKIRIEEIKSNSIAKKEIYL